VPGTLATSDGGLHGSSTAVCSLHPMQSGVHYVEVVLNETGGNCATCLGVVGQGFDAVGDHGAGLARNSAEAWLLDTYRCEFSHAGKFSTWQGTYSKYVTQGKPQDNEIKEIKAGAVFGLLLDLGQRTLSLYLDGARRGVMVAPGMQNMWGEAVAPLVGPLRWAVTVGIGGSARIQRRPAPGPAPAAEEVAAAVAWNRADENRRVPTIFD
jgi:hypothetical protein